MKVTMSQAPSQLPESLKSIQEMLQADGYDLVSHEGGSSALRLEIVAGPDACAECLVPKEVFRNIIGQYLTAPLTVDDLEITYPADLAE
jgi:hypothetical protein